MTEKEQPVSSATKKRAPSPPQFPSFNTSQEYPTHDWLDHGKCRAADPDAMFVDGAAQNRAVLICNGCPVKKVCLTDALENKVVGVWGGMTDRERTALLRKKNATISWGEIVARAEEAYPTDFWDKTDDALASVMKDIAREKKTRNITSAQSQQAPRLEQPEDVVEYVSPPNTDPTAPQALYTVVSLTPPEDLFERVERLRKQKQVKSPFGEMAPRLVTSDPNYFEDRDRSSAPYDIPDAREAWDKVDELPSEFLPEEVIKKEKVPRKRAKKPVEESPVEEDEVMKLLRESIAEFGEATEEDVAVNAPMKEHTTLNDIIPQIRFVAQSVFVSTPELNTRPLDESLVDLLTATADALSYISDQMHWGKDTPEFAYLCATLFAHSELYGPGKKENGQLVADYHSYRKQHGLNHRNTILQLMPYLDVEDPLMLEILDTMQQENPNYMNLRKKTTAYLSSHGGWSSLLQEKMKSSREPSANVLVSFVQKPDETKSLEFSEHFWFQEEEDTRTVREIILDAAKVGLGETYSGWDSIQSSDALRIALESASPNIVSFVNQTGWKASRPQFIFMCASLVTNAVGAIMSLEAQKEQLANRLNRYRQNHPDEIKSKLTLSLQVAPHLTEEDEVRKHLLSFLKTGEHYLTLQSELIAFLRENGGLADLSRKYRG